MPWFLWWAMRSSLQVVRSTSGDSFTSMAWFPTLECVCCLLCQILQQSHVDCMEWMHDHNRKLGPFIGKKSSFTAKFSGAHSFASALTLPRPPARQMYNILLMSATSISTICSVTQSFSSMMELILFIMIVTCAVNIAFDLIVLDLSDSISWGLAIAMLNMLVMPGFTFVHFYLSE